jgi:hypothetical protein
MSKVGAFAAEQPLEVLTPEAFQVPSVVGWMLIRRVTTE